MTTISSAEITYPAVAPAVNAATLRANVAYLLTEEGGNLLQDDGAKIYLESSIVTNWYLDSPVESTTWTSIP